MARAVIYVRPMSEHHRRIFTDVHATSASLIAAAPKIFSYPRFSL
jgi:hypothetical protein